MYNVLGAGMIYRIQSSGRRQSIVIWEEVEYSHLGGSRVQSSGRRQDIGIWEEVGYSYRGGRIQSSGKMQDIVIREELGYSHLGGGRIQSFGRRQDIVTLEKVRYIIAWEEVGYSHLGRGTIQSPERMQSSERIQFKTNFSSPCVIIMLNFYQIFIQCFPSCNTSTSYVTKGLLLKTPCGLDSLNSPRNQIQACGLLHTSDIMK